MVQTRPDYDYGRFRHELEEAAAAWFLRMGIATDSKSSHCLESDADWPQNIICADVTDYIKRESKRRSRKCPFPLHRLHNGLSSQAMVFNLIGPLIVQNDFGPLRDVIEQAGVSWPVGNVTVEFEYCDRGVFDEKDRQPTSLDVAILGDDRRIFIEGKLIEKRFRGCSYYSKCDCDKENPLLDGFDICYLHRRKRKYWERMIEFGFQETNLGSGHDCPFVSHYQFFRELLFSLKKNGCLVLLHDERNPVFLEASSKGKNLGLWHTLMESVPVGLTANIGRITVQQLVKTIDESGRHGDWIGEFKSKYGIE